MNPQAKKNPMLDRLQAALDKKRGRHEANIALIQEQFTELRARRRPAVENLFHAIMGEYPDALRLGLSKILKSLTEQEREVLQLRFGIGEGKITSLEEIARGYGVTRERIRQIEGQALRACRRKNLISVLTPFVSGNWQSMPVPSTLCAKCGGRTPTRGFGIEALDLSLRSYNGLRNRGIITLEELVSCTASELLKLKNFGPTSLRDVRQQLKNHGLFLSGEGPK